MAVLGQALVAAHLVIHGTVEPFQLSVGLGEGYGPEFISLISLLKIASSNAVGFYDPFRFPLRAPTKEFMYNRH